MPDEYEKCLVGLTAILRELGILRSRQKIQAMSLAKECYSMKLDLLTNATVVDDAIRFVSEKSKDKEKEQVKSSSSDSSSNEDNNKESNEPDYNDEEKSDKASEEKQEHETDEITINQVF